MTIASILKASKKYIEKLYLHTMTVYEYQTITKPNGSKRQELLPMEGLVDIPCRISFTKINYDNPNHTTPTTNPIQAKPKVFCKPNVDIKAGSIVYVSVGSKVYKGKASDICLYDDNHIEFVLGIDTEA